ncbi:MATE family efflux transporter [Acidaminobacterium chupaoyuni]
MEKKQVNSDIFRMVLPIVIENILQMSAGVITTAMIGRLMADDISAQGIGNRITNTYWALFKGIGVGATVIVALRYGQHKFDQCRRTVEQTYLTAIPASFLCVALTLLFFSPILHLFTQDAALLDAARRFARIAIFAVPFMALSSVNAAAYNGHGNTRTPMFIAVLMNCVNIIVGFVLIFGLGPFPALGLTGAAISTVVSWAVGGLTGTFLLYTKNGYCAQEHHGQSFFTVDLPCLKEIYKTGVPAACENVFWQLSAIVLSNVILGYGSAYFAAYQIGLQAEMICEMPGIGFVTASTSLAARAIGEGDDTLYRLYFRQMRKFSFYTGVLATVLLFTCAGSFMKILTDKADIRALGMVYVSIMGFAQIPQDLNKAYNGTMRAAGYRNTPMVISFIGIWCVRVPMALIFGKWLHWNIAFIWVAIALDQIIRTLLCMVIFRKRKVLEVITDGRAAALQLAEPEPAAAQS